LFDDVFIGIVSRFVRGFSALYRDVKSDEEQNQKQSYEPVEYAHSEGIDARESLLIQNILCIVGVDSADYANSNNSNK
jgi:hypothetical protein